MHCMQMSRSVLTTLFKKCAEHMSCVCQVSGVYITFVIMSRLDLYVSDISHIAIKNFIYSSRNLALALSLYRKQLKNISSHKRGQTLRKRCVMCS
jgi:hypothetical protein